MLNPLNLQTIKFSDIGFNFTFKLKFNRNTEIFKTRNMKKIITALLFILSSSEFLHAQDPKKVVINDKSTIPPVESLNRTILDVTLLGTAIGTKIRYAVIEDNIVKLQALYEIGDKIQEATVKDILKDKVILRFNNRDFLLKTDLTQSPASTSVNSDETISSGTKEITVDEKKILSSFKSIDDLKRQIRIRPLLHDGESEGLLLYNIQQNSFFHTLGFQSGDVLKQVNGNAVVSLEEAFKIYQTLQDATSVKILLSRKGKEREIIYRLRPDDMKLQ